jgi:hypothetical protein
MNAAMLRSVWENPIGGAPYRVGVFGAVTFASQAIAHQLLRKFGPQFYVDAPADKQKRGTMYLTCIANAVVMSVFSFSRPSSPKTAEEGRLMRRMLELLMGYMVSDLACISWAQHPADVFHHFVALGLAACVTLHPTHLTAFVCPMMRLEVSSVLLNTWFLSRDFPELHDSAPAVFEAIPKAFAACFAAVRIVYLPYFMFDMKFNQTEVYDKGLGGGGKVAVWGLVALQYYWFSLIVKKVSRAAKRAGSVVAK